jgi:hypothetical protein
MSGGGAVKSRIDTTVTLADGTEHPAYIEVPQLRGSSWKDDIRRQNYGPEDTLVARLIDLSQRRWDHEAALALQAADRITELENQVAHLIDCARWGWRSLDSGSPTG